jgi:hypothetical protein
VASQARTADIVAIGFQECGIPLAERSFPIPNRIGLAQPV